MKVFVDRKGTLYNVVIILGSHAMAKTNVLGQDLGKTIEEFTNGAPYQSIDTLPEGIALKKGAVIWKLSTP